MYIMRHAIRSDMYINYLKETQSSTINEPISNHLALRELIQRHARNQHKIGIQYFCTFNCIYAHKSVLIMCKFAKNNRRVICALASIRRRRGRGKHFSLYHLHHQWTLLCNLSVPVYPSAINQITNRIYQLFIKYYHLL